MKKIKRILEWYKDEPWYAIPRDAYLGFKFGLIIGYQCLKLDWKSSRDKDEK